MQPNLVAHGTVVYGAFMYSPVSLLC